jgi:membrane protein insertase Oxa1/YidC/SpoIIIJ
VIADKFDHWSALSKVPNDAADCFFVPSGWSAIRTELVLRSGRFAVVAKGLPQFVANFLKKLVSFQWGRSCSFVTFSVRLTISWLNLAAATRSTG